VSLRRKAAKKAWVSSPSSHDADALFVRVFAVILMGSLHGG